MFSPRVERAVTTMLEAHGLRRRKAGGTFEATHVLAVGLIVADFGGSEDAVVGAILHDTLEDTALAPATIREQFGAHVLSIVTDVTEPPKSVSWRRRKEDYIAHLRRSPRDDARTVASADKIHNLASMAHGLESHGAAFADVFSTGLDEMIWYQQAVHQMLAAAWSHRILEEHARQLDRFLLAARNAR